MSMFSHWDEYAPDDDYGTMLFRHWLEDEPKDFKPVKSEEDEKD